MTATTVDDAREPVDEAAFRRKVQDFLDTHATRKSGDDEPTISERVDAAAVQRAKDFQARLFDAGLAGITWPTEYGGQGLPARYRTIYNDEAAGYDTPDRIFGIGFGMCIPTVLAHGTEEHKRRYVPVAAQGEEVWCQLFSEPWAGSDLASLRSSVVRDGDEWILNGQKVWTSGAHYSRRAIILCRSDASQPKHRGLSMFILDMQAPGVTVRPLRQMTGQASFNEVFFDDVRIPADHILGDPGDGWRVAITTLMNERVFAGAAQSAEKTSRLTPIATHLELARKRGLTGDPVVRQDLADLFIRYWVMDMLGLRIRTTVPPGGVPGPEGSMAKLAGATLARLSSSVACRLAGAAAMTAWDDDGSPEHAASQMVLAAPASGIAGGSNQVMGNIIGERMLGLPKEPQVDRDIPFRDLLSAT